MKKRDILIGLSVLALILGGCGTPGEAVSDKAEAPIQTAVEAPIQAAQTTVEAQAAPLPNPYYTGEGGKDLSIAILAPQGKGLAADQNYLPALVQGEFVSNFSGYSAISVLDRVQLDNQYTELFSGYYDDNAEKGMDLGHLTPTDYIMGGSIIKTTAGYALQIQITKTEGKTTAASYSGTCTFAELDNLNGVRQASLDLLQKMGVELSERAKAELAGAVAANHVNAQTALAQGITAQKGGTVVEALAYYYQAATFDSSLLEAANRASVMSADISSGNIGENVRNDIQRRNEWQKILAEAEGYFSKHPPYEIVYDPKLTQGKVDYENETVSLSFPLEVKPADGFKIVNTILSGLKATGKQKEWGMQYWPLSSPVFVDKVTSSSEDHPVHSGDDMYHRDILKKVSIAVQLVNSTGTVIAATECDIFCPLKFRNFKANANVFERGVQVRDHYTWDSYVVAETGYHRYDYHYIDGAYKYSSGIVFEGVNANDITDNMTVQIVSVNGIDAENIAKTGYIKILTEEVRK